MGHAAKAQGQPGVSGVRDFWSSVWLVVAMTLLCALAAAIVIGIVSAVISAFLTYWWLLIPVVLAGIVGFLFTMMALEAGT
jgi:FtsH-binding integral membrane protein